MIHQGKTFIATCEADDTAYSVENAVSNAINQIVAAVPRHNMEFVATEHVAVSPHAVLVTVIMRVEDKPNEEG